MHAISTQFHAKFITYATSTLLPLTLLSSLHAGAVSLDATIQEQLGVANGSVPCANLFDSGANPTGNLENICARAVPVSVSPNASGGGSAVTAVNPSTGQPIAPNEDTMSKNMGNWDIFATLENESLDRDPTATEGAFDSTINRYLFGASFLPSVSSSYSVALNISEHDGDYANGGYFSHESTGLAFIGRNGFNEHFGLSYSAQFDNVSSSRERRARFSDIANNGTEYNITEGSPFSDYDYSQYGFSVNGTYDFNKNALTVSPSLGLEWQKRDIGTHTEAGESGLELTFHDEDITSFQALLGVQGSIAINTSFGAFIPQFAVLMRHEFEADERDVTFSFAEDSNSVRFAFQTDKLDSDYFELSAGGVLVLQNGVQVFANARTFAAHDYYDSFSLSAGFRMEM